jgi:hypothetical protein
MGQKDRPERRGCSGFYFCADALGFRTVALATASPAARYLRCRLF